MSYNMEPSDLYAIFKERLAAAGYTPKDCDNFLVQRAVLNVDHKLDKQQRVVWVTAERLMVVNGGVLTPWWWRASNGRRGEAATLSEVEERCGETADRSPAFFFVSFGT
jgi:hypothetical protein